MAIRPAGSESGRDTEGEDVGNKDPGLLFWRGCLGSSMKGRIKKRKPKDRGGGDLLPLSA